uniref:Uncharacterized protein n=1 Tax=Wuchereria bancrofti TaxID=6293 RepID=A0AAF5PL74_WUCBA
MLLQMFFFYKCSHWIISCWSTPKNLYFSV